MVSSDDRANMALSAIQPCRKANVRAIANFATPEIVFDGDWEYGSLKNALERLRNEPICLNDFAKLFRKSLRAFQPAGLVFLLPELMVQAVEFGDLETTDSLLLFFANPENCSHTPSKIRATFPLELQVGICAFLSWVELTQQDIERDWVELGKRNWCG